MEIVQRQHGMDDNSGGALEQGTGAHAAQRLRHASRRAQGIHGERRVLIEREIKDYVIVAKPEEKGVIEKLSEERIAEAQKRNDE